MQGCVLLAVNGPLGRVDMAPVGESTSLHPACCTPAKLLKKLMQLIVLCQ